MEAKDRGIYCSVLYWALVEENSRNRVGLNSTAGAMASSSEIFRNSNLKSLTFQMDDKLAKYNNRSLWIPTRSYLVSGPA